MKRPGELARRLDQLLRETYKEPVIRSFASVAEKVSTPVLLQVREHFLHRSEHADVRVFFPKGSLAKCHSERNDLPDLRKCPCEDLWTEGAYGQGVSV